MSFDDKYTKYSFKSEWDNDMMIAFLSQLPFDSFEENSEEVIAYLPTRRLTDKLNQEIEEICDKYKLKHKIKEIKNRNWNKEWETNFKPVSINSFCLIKAEFHKDLDESWFQYIINITPEMTFGTGHHETTFTMIQLMQDIVMDDKVIFDFGSGTGILAMLAEKMGARSIVAIDNDPIAIENIKRNAKANDSMKIKVKLADTADVDRFTFDIVLANINRNILENEAVNLSLALKKGGFLLLSGILLTDKEYITEIYENNSMKLMRSIDKGKWSALKFVAY